MARIALPCSPTSCLMWAAASCWGVRWASPTSGPPPSPSPPPATTSSWPSRWPSPRSA
ncbi:hypothetical protein QJS66_10795 [Kocuria rhizophila]|nr:hypothetical protein QJS66_10795 [Kocuria rhizophila]